MRIAHVFVENVVKRNIILRNQSFELFILNQLPQMLNSFLCSSEMLKETITYLSVKMRYFDLKIRVSALQTMKEIGKNLDSIDKEWNKIFK